MENSDIESTNEMQRLLTKWIEEERYCGKYCSTEDDSTKLRILEKLCQAGADLNHLEKERGFACLPCVFWCQDLIQFFLDRGSNINLPDERGNTVLHVAIENGQFHSSSGGVVGVCPKNKTKKVVKFLLRHSADPNLTNKRGETPLTVLMRTKANSSTNKRVLKVAKMLVESASGDPATWKSYGETMLLNGYKNSLIIDYCSKVFGNEIDVDIRTSSIEYSMTPLMLAAKLGLRKCCQMLINMGANVNAQDLQGFTALHYALTWECATAKLLINAGADPNLESVSGRNCYDLYDHHNVTGCLNISKLGGETTAQEQVKVLEIMGAAEILKNGEDGTSLWKQAMDVCREFGLEPSPEFMANYEFLRDHPDSRREIIYDSAMEAVVRLSNGINKLWNLLSFAAEKDEVPDSSRHILNFLFSSEEFKNVESFASLEQDHFHTLLNLVNYFSDWAENLRARGSNIEFMNEGISHLHAVTRLTIACFEKLMHATGSKNTLSSDGTIGRARFYFELCCTLAQIHSNLNDVISKKAFNENKRLLRSLVQLNLKDKDENTLLHFIIQHSYVEIFGSDQVIFNLLDFVSDVTSRDFRGYEPVQLINTSIDNLMDYYRNLLLKMADAGAHLDTKNAKKGRTLLEVFREECEPHLSLRYDSLQCACARTLARSLVPYVNKVPPKMVHFIRAHLEVSQGILIRNEAITCARLEPRVHK